MGNNLFFSSIVCSHDLENVLNQFCEKYNDAVYLINKPLLIKNAEYQGSNMVLIVPKHKLLFVEQDDSKTNFEDFKEDFCEDLGYISNKYNYQSDLGRPRVWKEKYFSDIKYNDLIHNVDTLDKFEIFLSRYKLSNREEYRKQKFICSLAIGSINDIDKIGGEYPDTVLDTVKKNIILFDGKQTSFIYDNDTSQKEYYIQGLAGTGKTELLLNKLKDLYISDNNSKIVFTCFSTILADSMRKRVPDFFNFMKVEEQIKWDERLWVMRSWGSKSSPNSGLYSYICNKYSIPFRAFSSYNKIDFDFVCKEALEYINSIDNKDFKECFDYILIDESQDFPESFFELCVKVTKNKIYVAGDVFQNIYDRNIGRESYSLLLNKCYRTDPKTLMFAHSLGMGLYEKPVIRWLSKKDWENCGYEIQEESNNRITLTRRPLNRFDDLDQNIINTDIRRCNVNDYKDLKNTIINIIDDIKNSNPTVEASDISIIFAENHLKRGHYSIIDNLAFDLYNRYKWKINKGYETKQQAPDSLMISSKNYIKGLEYPFVICVAPQKISNDIFERNSLYMILTRSFITSYFIMNNDDDLYDLYNKASDEINKFGKMNLRIPNEEEIQASERNLSINAEKTIIDNSFIRDTIINFGEEAGIKSLDDLNEIMRLIDKQILSNPTLKSDINALKTKIKKLVDFYSD